MPPSAPKEEFCWAFFLFSKPLSKGVQSQEDKGSSRSLKLVQVLVDHCCKEVPKKIMAGLGGLYKPPKSPQYVLNSSFEFSSPPLNILGILSLSRALFCTIWEAISSFTLLGFLFDYSGSLTHTLGPNSWLRFISLSHPQKKIIYFLFYYYLTSFFVL
ncbi:hypothetical protein Taro_033757 [Colocasia esculenta]|uniref:Uncharacterized protein n=1 Tax=Colocasia esculenta TaxID=4460 RepID=A0A843VW21_COLES|nr:hypothetical protein [Colocasia esculenta]